MFRVTDFVCYAAKFKILKRNNQVSIFFEDMLDFLFLYCINDLRLIIFVSRDPRKILCFTGLILFQIVYFYVSVS